MCCLALILGGMIAFDMGGPVNKTAFFFGAAMISEGNYQIMGACAAAICTPPLGMGLATLLQEPLESRRNGKPGSPRIAMGLIGITEGAIPFAAADPIRVIPSIMVGSAVAAVIAMVGTGRGPRSPRRSDRLARRRPQGWHILRPSWPEPSSPPFRSSC